MKYSKENLEKYVKECDTITDLTKKIRNSLTASRSSINLVSRKLKEFDIDTSHFVGSSKTWHNLIHVHKDYNLVLVNNHNLTTRITRRTLLNAIINEGSLEQKCAHCGIIDYYNNKPINLQIDHINGDWKNNLITNLRFLCPNCHSQTETYGFKGIIKY